MKNVSLTITNTIAPNYIPPVPPMQHALAPPAPVGSPFIQPKVYTVSFSAQFDEEAEAIKFAAELLNKVSGDAS